MTLKVTVVILIHFYFYVSYFSCSMTSLTRTSLENRLLHTHVHGVGPIHLDSYPLQNHNYLLTELKYSQSYSEKIYSSPKFDGVVVFYTNLFVGIRRIPHLRYKNIICEIFNIQRKYPNGTARSDWCSFHGMGTPVNVDIKVTRIVKESASIVIFQVTTTNKWQHRQSGPGLAVEQLTFISFKDCSNMTNPDGAALNLQTCLATSKWICLNSKLSCDVSGICVQPTAGTNGTTYKERVQECKNESRRHLETSSSTDYDLNITRKREGTDSNSPSTNYSIRIWFACAGMVFILIVVIPSFVLCIRHALHRYELIYRKVPAVVYYIPRRWESDNRNSTYNHETRHTSLPVRSDSTIPMLADDPRINRSHQFRRERIERNLITDGTVQMIEEPISTDLPPSYECVVTTDLDLDIPPSYNEISNTKDVTGV